MKEKFYLGISLGFNSSACIVSNKRGLLAAISQERMNGEKNTKELPFDAVAKCIEICDVKEIEQVAISHYENITDEYFQKYQSANAPFQLGIVTDWQECIFNVLEKLNVIVINKSIRRIAHHLAHAYSTFGFYGFPESECYTITSDGFGDGLSAVITHISANGEEKVISRVPLKNSIALVYQFVTGALGFKEHQHEGKITGLAAYGKPIHLKVFENLYRESAVGNFLDFKDDEYKLDSYELEKVVDSAIIDFDKFLKLKKAVYEMVYVLQDAYHAKREDIAASVQEFAEKWTLKWIKANCDIVNVPCYIAGGLFANVKINQRIKDLGMFKEVFVCPAMGDEGTAVGAAVIASGWRNIVNEPSEKVISGSSVAGNVTTQIKVLDYLDKKGIADKYVVSKSDDVAKDIVDRLADNKIVCLMRGKMEFGPRALCHRSILYNCDSKDTNDWLNKKLSRTEFMPFAPVCREEVATDLFKNVTKGWTTAKYMTMTFDCTDEFIQNYPAACHIDNTARPQIVSPEDDAFMWCVLKDYEERTGKKALINTSFNLHNWPIIESEKVGLESWITSDTDCLVIGDIIIEKKS